MPKVLLRVNLGVFPVKAKYVVPNSGDYSLKLTLTINKINYYLSIPDPVKPILLGSVEGSMKTN